MKALLDCTARVSSIYLILRYLPGIVPSTTVSSWYSIFFILLVDATAVNIKGYSVAIVLVLLKCERQKRERERKREERETRKRRESDKRKMSKTDGVIQKSKTYLYLFD